MSLLHQIGPEATFEDENQIVNYFVRANNFTRMEWHANSTDLNSIEHVRVTEHNATTHLKVRWICVLA